jgi:phage-related protein
MRRILESFIVFALNISIASRYPYFKEKLLVKKSHNHFQPMLFHRIIGELEIGVIHRVFHDITRKTILWHLLFQFNPQKSKETNEFLISLLKISCLNQFFVNIEMFLIEDHGYHLIHTCPTSKFIVITWHKSMPGHIFFRPNCDLNYIVTLSCFGPCINEKSERHVILLKDWFIWNGVSCAQYEIYVSEQPPITIPSERATFTNVPGRPGSLTTLEGEDVYDDMVLTATCFLADPSQIPAIAAWLKGSSTVSFANRQGGFYYARVANQVSFEKILRGNAHRTFAVNFRCKPFWYAANVEPITLTESGTFITNPGSVYSEPMITVYGSGDITLMVGTTVVELTGIDGNIILDTPLMEAYKDTAGMNGSMSGDFPALTPGANAVGWSGNVTSVVIQPNWRYL